MDERTLVTDEDPALDAAARVLAERSASSGRLYAVVTLGPLERGRLLKAADAVEGVSARAEGEGRLRRLVLTHFSQRYADPERFRAEAAAAYAGEIVVAADLDRIAVPARG